ncbi:MAG: hypothetical protein H6799_01045 [Candidatus Nomurabacteria bacterium]|nr:MAG: hypothetical protein H6799_01045 [Candidatus Nomurabacteria bacterium]HRV76150.1 hypothetical protein [Candidatus Saccharimonadales bacterium]
MKKIPKISKPNLKGRIKRSKDNDGDKVVSSQNNIVVAGQGFENTEITTKKRIKIPSPRYSHREISGRFTHHILSIALPLAVYSLVAVFYLPWVALSLIILSKWQIFIVKPRFWWANLKFSAVDLIFKLSILTLLVMAQFKIDALVTKSTLILTLLQISLVGLYLYWNVHLRKQTSPKGMRLQALLAQGLALTAIAWASGFSGPNTPLPLALMTIWIVCYSTAQHCLFAYEESAIPQLASLWALFGSSIMFLQLIWAQNFLFFNQLLYLPLMTFVVSGFGYFAAKSHAFIEDKQSEQDVPKVQIEREKQELNKQAVIAVGITTFLALLIALR